MNFKEVEKNIKKNSRWTKKVVKDLDKRIGKLNKKLGLK